MAHVFVSRWRDSSNLEVTLLCSDDYEAMQGKCDTLEHDIESFHDQGTHCACARASATCDIIVDC